MKSTRFSCQILMKFEFSRHISKNTQIQNLIKTHPIEAELFHADRQIDSIDEANSRFSQFSEGPKLFFFKPKSYISRKI